MGSMVPPSFERVQDDGSPVSERVQECWVSRRPWSAGALAAGYGEPMRIAILDDYQNVALTFGDWDSLKADITVFTKPLDDVVRQLQGFEAIVAMRERTRFPAEVLDRLPDLKLLVSTGKRNAAIDVA